MRRLLTVAMLAFSFVLYFVLNFSDVSAISSKVLISQIQAGASSSEISITTETSATKEYISIYNNDLNDIDITNWCLSNKSNVHFNCFIPGTLNLRYILPSFGYATISSDSFSTQNSYTPDFIYPTTNHTSGSITGSTDNITLLDADGGNVDTVTWDKSLTGGSVFVRKFLSDSTLKMLDTDSIDDFQKSTSLSIVPSSLSELLLIVDICPNIAGTQDIIPDGYVFDSTGDCVVPPDVCLNIDGLQLSLPVGYGLDERGNCVNLDLCPNLDGLQLVVPFGYKMSEDNDCVVNLLSIKINELLANAVGDDDGNEFIELYNPNNETVDLSFYKLQVGTGTVKTYQFPSGDYINPHEYKSYNNHDIGFTLVNSGSTVSIINIYGEEVDKTSYSNSDEGMAWALIGGVWQFTNQPTPGQENLISIEELVTDSGDVLGAKICAPNQYLSPDTNRCRLIVVQTPCKDGQYRSEETNRCRSIASDVSVLQSCAENQERNPATNRCRLIASSSSEPTPCAEGQERNPDTNRCRNIVSSIPQAEYRVEPIPVIRNSSDLWILGGVLVAAFGYAIWEWRYEIKQLFIKYGKYFQFNK